MFSLRSSLLRLGGKTYAGCFPDASQMLPRCLSDASHMPPRCLPLHDSFSMISPPVIPPPWLLVMDFSCMIFQVCLQRNSVWGLALGSWIQYLIVSFILDLQENIYTKVKKTYYMSAGEAGWHVVGFGDLSIDVFLEVPNKKHSWILYLIG